MCLLSYLLNYGITVASRCFPVYQIQFLTLLHYSINLVIVGFFPFFSLIWACSAESHFTYLIQQSSDESLAKEPRVNQGFPPASGACRTLESSWHILRVWRDGWCWSRVQNLLSWLPWAGGDDRTLRDPQDLGTSSLQPLQSHLLPSCF